MVLLLFFLSFSIIFYSLSDADPSLLLANGLDVRLISVNNPNSTQIVKSRLNEAKSCDYLFHDNLVYWIEALDYKKGKIGYTNLRHPQSFKVVVSGLEQPDGLAIDWIGKKIYWTDAETNRIEVSELDGSSRKVLMWGNLDQPRAIAVDPHNKYMYWTDWGEVPKIERAGMDGSHRQLLVKDNIYWPNGITLDYDEEKVYWVEANFHFIHRMNMDGSDREEVLNQNSIDFGSSLLKPPLKQWSTMPVTNIPSSHNSPSEESKDDDKHLHTLQHPFAITLLDEWIYWTDWATDSIHAVLKNGSGIPKLIKKSGISPMDLQAFSSERQRPGINPCGNNNGGCSHLCLLSPDPPFRRCACPTGIIILPDNKTCEDGPSEILLLARRADLRLISLDTDDYSDVLIPVSNVMRAVAIEYDPVDKFVYWTDDGQKAIMRAHLNGSGSEFVVTHNVEQSDGIAIDWIARNIYWTDTARDYISVARLNGSSPKVLIETGIEEPRAIVLDPVAGHLYWSDWGDNAKIERADLDGGDRLILVDTDVEWPNGLALDHDNSQLFWADARRDRIEVISLNGTGRKIVLSEEIPHIFGLSLLGNYLYWTDWQRRRIERMRIGNRRSRRVIINQFPDIFGVKAASMSVPPGTNACAVNNGGCSHLCLFTPRGAICECPAGLVLSDSSRRCVVPEAFLLCSFTNVGGVRRLSLGAKRSGAEIPFTKLADPSFLDFSVSDDRIYWTNTKQMVIMHSFLNGSNVEPLIDSGIEFLEGMAVDWVGRNVYWADSSTNRIELAHMDRPIRKLIVWKDIESPRCLALDPPNGYMYWSQWGGVPSIKRAKMDGSDVIQITKGTTGRANSLTIDYDGQRLYWVDFDINTIVSSDMNGNELIDIVRGGSTKTISSLALYGEFVYWSDSKRRLIERANKITGSGEYVIESGLNDVDDIMVYHASRQVGVTSCSHDNGGCEYFCLSLPGGRRTCACPDHYSLNSDNRTCTAPANFLLMSQTRYIARFIFQANGSNLTIVPGRGKFGSRPRKYSPSPDAVLPLSGIQDACAIDFDPIGGRLYWIDCKSAEIRSSAPNGSEMRVLLRTNRTKYHPYDLAVDAYSKLLFWTDLASNSINLMKLDGTAVGTVLTGTVPGPRKPIEIMPRKIAVDPMRGRLYFSNACQNVASCRYKIMQAALDGSDCITFFDRELRNVSAITVDVVAKRLYWADENKIEVSKLDGSGRKILIDGNLKQVVGLAVFGQNLYWADAQMDGGLIEGANKVAPKRKKIQSRVRNLRDLISVISMEESALTHHPCSDDNGGCSHICVTKEDGSTRCSCPNHLTLTPADNFQCGEPSTCGPNHFTCKRKQQCVPSSWRCDNEVECIDGTDEEGCPPLPQCKGDQFSCGQIRLESFQEPGFLHSLMETKPQCIEKILVCDGHDDCINGQDEQDCPSCKAGEIACHSGLCVPIGTSCDGCHGASCPKGANLSEQNQGNTFAIVIGIVCGCALLIGIGVYLRHCMTNDNNPYPPGVVMFTPNSNGHLNLNVEFQPHDESNPTRTFVVGGRNKQSSLNFAIVPPASTNGSGSQMTSRSEWPTRHRDGRLIERPSIPGASSNSSVKRHAGENSLPQNEPGHEGYLYSSDTPSTRSMSYCRCKSSHKHRKHGKPPVRGAPPPTPCDTDTCDDACSPRPPNAESLPHEPPPPYYYPHSCCHHCYHQHNFPSASSSGSLSSRHCGPNCVELPMYDRHRNGGGRRRHYRQFVGLNSDSDPCPPPPTPRSLYMSECCDTTEVEDVPEVEEITARIEEQNDKEEDDDETVVLLESSSQRQSPSITERSYSTLLDNPPPSPVTDSS